MSWGYPCSSSILMGYSIINHPANGGTTILGSLHMTKNMRYWLWKSGSTDIPWILGVSMSISERSRAVSLWSRIPFMIPQYIQIKDKGGSGKPSCISISMYLYVFLCISMCSCFSCFHVGCTGRKCGYADP
jgi:hypothetical protein